MWTRSGLKEKAKMGVKRNYWKTVLVALIFGLIFGGFAAAGGAGHTFATVPEASTASTMPDTSSILGATVDTAQTTAVASQIPAAFWAILIVLAILIVAFAIFAAVALVNPFGIGTYKYSLNALRGKGNISDLGSGFDVSYKRNVKVMFFYDLYLILWSMLFAIPGIIKAYEYRMIPYILADNPEMDKTEVFKLSKAMMKGNKWRAFVLDLSFILWDFLSCITLGFVGAFWVSPYKLLTNAALYDALKQN